jgi:polysaccharide export outer membrane protein
MSILRVLIGMGVLMSLACAGTPVSPGRPTTPPEYHVAPPDLLLVTVRPDPAIERQVTVRPDGSVSLDLIGDVQVEGKTVNEIRAEITNRITDYIVAPDVTVELVQSKSRRFYVFGQVKRPGAFPLIGRVTAVEALAQAGDVNVLASADSSHLVRPNDEGAGVYAVRYNDIPDRIRHPIHVLPDPGHLRSRGPMGSLPLDCCAGAPALAPDLSSPRSSGSQPGGTHPIARSPKPGDWSHTDLASVFRNGQQWPNSTELDPTVTLSPFLHRSGRSCCSGS